MSGGMFDTDADPVGVGEMLDDPGLSRCRCGWPLLRCGAQDGKVPGGYDYAPRLAMQPGNPCRRGVPVDVMREKRQ